MTFVLLYSSRLLPPVTEIETQRENIYVLIQNNNNQFWGQNVMLDFNVWKGYFNHASLPLYIYIYMNLTYTSRDPGWLDWGFIIKHLVFTIGALVATQETCANVLFPEHENIEV